MVFVRDDDLATSLYDYHGDLRVDRVAPQRRLRGPGHCDVLHHRHVQLVAPVHLSLKFKGGQTEWCDPNRGVKTTVIFPGM